MAIEDDLEEYAHDDWEAEALWYNPYPYRKAFILENRVMGHGQCCLHGIPCYATVGRDGDCKYLFDCWPTAYFCGPEFVRKYNISKEKAR